MHPRKCRFPEIIVSIQVHKDRFCLVCLTNQKGSSFLVPEVPLRGSLSGSLKMKVQNFFSSVWHALHALALGVPPAHTGVLLWFSNYNRSPECLSSTKSRRRIRRLGTRAAGKEGAPSDADLDECPHLILGMGDSSWADVKPSRKSTSCNYIMCNNALVHWRSKVASILATSTTEDELISAAGCSQDVAFCRKLANGIGVMQTKPTVLREDSNGCLSLARQARGFGVGG